MRSPEKLVDTCMHLHDILPKVGIPQHNIAKIEFRFFFDAPPARVHDVHVKITQISIGSKLFVIQHDARTAKLLGQVLISTSFHKELTGSWALRKTRT